jgi:excinuclease UvrABC nuclease subunit
MKLENFERAKELLADIKALEESVKFEDYEIPKALEALDQAKTNKDKICVTKLHRRKGTGLSDEVLTVDADLYLELLNKSKFRKETLISLYKIEFDNL